MSELLYKDEVFKLVGHCMEVHGELGNGEGLSFMRQNIFTRISRIFAKSDLTSAPVSNSRELAKFA
jgi:hypothetical protein